MSETTPIKLRIRLQFETLDEFVQGFAKYVSAGGLFIPLGQDKLKPVGTGVRFQFLLKDGENALLGEGEVRQVLQPPSPKTGILVKFKKLSKSSQKTVKQIVAYKQHIIQEQSSEATLAMPGQVPPPEATSFDRRSNTVATAVKKDATISLPQPPVAPSNTSLEMNSNITNDDIDSQKHNGLGNLETRASNEPQVVAQALQEATQVKDGLAESSIMKSDTPTVEDAMDGLLHEDSENDFFDIAQSYAGATLDNQSSNIVEEKSEPKISLSINGLEAPSTGLDKISVPSLSPEVARTEGGLSIMAYNSEANIQEESMGLAAFSMADDDADIDEAFDNIFGGGGGASAGFDLFGSDTTDDPPFEAPAVSEPVEVQGPPPSAELESLLGSIEGENNNEDLTSLNLDLAPSPNQHQDDSDDEDEESLEDLLALARQDIQNAKAQDDTHSTQDVLEHLLGDANGLGENNDQAFLTLPPPKLDNIEEDEDVAIEAQDDASSEEETPEEEAPEEKPKKSGLFSSLFRKRSDS